ncbi:MAG: polyhydroxyalkanoate depolymerase, partial [Actinomycetes bacterium]
AEPAPEPVAVVAEPEPEPVAPPKPKATRDDLTRIRGIGEGMQTRLNEIGIFSFAQLVSTSVPKIREALGDVGRMARIDEWIDQAQELSESE